MATNHIQAWNVSEADYPAADGTAQNKFLINYAILAPSAWNSQPWKFKIFPNSIELYDDKDRDHGHRDPDGRERIISCGTAAFNLKTAIKYFGHTPEVELYPDLADSSLVAVIRSGLDCPKASNETIFRAITKRHSYRSHFDDKAVDEAVIEAMQKAAGEEEASFIPITSESTKMALSGMVAEGDRDIGSNENARNEFAAWVKGSEKTNDGLPGYALGMNKVESLLAPISHRMFNYTDSNAHRDKELALKAPMLGVIATEEDTPADWCRGGMALQHVLLTGAANGVQASVLNQPIPVPELRERLRILLGTKLWPQAVLRLGYTSEDIKPTPRRAPEEMILEK